MNIISAITTPFRKAWLSKDYGQLIIWMAVGVGIPRWAGAMFAADGIRFTAQSSGLMYGLYVLFVSMYGLSGFAMAILEVLAIGYVFDALRVMKPKTPKGRINIRWWGSLGFAIGLLFLMPIILAPHMLAQLTGVDIITFLQTRELQSIWIISVILVPMVIIGGVSFARAGLVGDTTPRLAIPLAPTIEAESNLLHINTINAETGLPEFAAMVHNERSGRRVRTNYEGLSEIQILELKKAARRERARLRRERRKNQ